MTQPYASLEELTFFLRPAMGDRLSRQVLRMVLSCAAAIIRLADVLI
jgi:hypothetical protein